MIIVKFYSSGCHPFAKEDFMDFSAWSGQGLSCKTNFSRYLFQSIAQNQFKDLSWETKLKVIRRNKIKCSLSKTNLKVYHTKPIQMFLMQNQFEDFLRETNLKISGAKLFEWFPAPGLVNKLMCGHLAESL